MFKQVILLNTGGSEGRSKCRSIPIESLFRASRVEKIKRHLLLGTGKTGGWEVSPTRFVLLFSQLWLPLSHLADLQ